MALRLPNQEFIKGYNMEYKKTLTDYIKARYSLLVIESFEEERVVRELGQIAKEINHTLFVWNSTEGVTLNGAVIGDKTNDLKLAIDFCETKQKKKMIVSYSPSVMPIIILIASQTLCIEDG